MQGDFEAFYLRHFKAIYRVCYAFMKNAAEPDEKSEVVEAVMALPVKYKEVVWLHYYEGYQTDEIAEMLHRPPSTVRGQLRDARAKLKLTLGGERI